MSSVTAQAKHAGRQQQREVSGSRRREAEVRCAGSASAAKCYRMLRASKAPAAKVRDRQYVAADTLPVFIFARLFSSPSRSVLHS